LGRLTIAGIESWPPAGGVTATLVPDNETDSEPPLKVHMSVALCAPSVLGA
jgi:hypothetical protein